MSPIIPVGDRTSQEETVIVGDKTSRLSITSSVSSSSTTRILCGGGNTTVNKSGNVTRLDYPLPFFLRNDVFSDFGNLEYNWNSKKMMVLFVESPDSGKYVAPIVPTAPRTKTDEYSIGGCPLECPFDVNEDFDEALYMDTVPTVFNTLYIPAIFSAMNINNGRWAVRQVVIQEEPFVQEMNLVKGTLTTPDADCPIVSFVDCSDQDRPLIFTGIKNANNKIFNGGFNVHLMGRFRPDADILKISTFKAYHETNVFTFDNRPITSVAHAIYEKLHGEYPSRGKVYLEFMFKEPNNIFDLPPEDSRSKIAIRPLPGDANPSMKSLWNEIEDLERWINMLPSCSEIGPNESGTFLNSTVYEISEGKITENIIAVQELLAKEPAIDLHRASSIEFSDSLDQVLHRVAQQERADCDFTDRVWAIVRKCDTVDELQECLHLVFQSVANKMYRPYLLLTNTTTMAKNLTMVMKGEMACLLRMGHYGTMIKVVIECGLRKLFKDYNFALAMSHLIERGEVDHFTPSISDIITSFNNLKRLHCILEVMCLSKERLTLSVNIQESHVKKMLKLFSESESQGFDWNQTYHFDVLPNDVRRVMSGLHPFYYKVKMDSVTLLKWATTTVVVSTEQYINHKRCPSDDIHSRLYYVYLINESGRLEK